MKLYKQFSVLCLTAALAVNSPVSVLAASQQYKTITLEEESENSSSKENNKSERQVENLYTGSELKDFSKELKTLYEDISYSNDIAVSKQDIVEVDNIPMVSAKVLASNENVTVDVNDKEIILDIADETISVSETAIKTDDKTAAINTEMAGDDTLVALEEVAQLAGCEIREETADIVLAKPFQSKILIVHTDKKIDNLTAVNSFSLGNIQVLQYETESDAKKAYDKYISQGLTVEVDTFLESAASTTPAAPKNLYEYTNNTALSSVKVALIDTGVNETSVVKGRLEQGINTSAEKNNTDNHSHGTTLAEIIAENTGANVTIHSIKAADSNGKASLLSVYAGIFSALDAGADIINISLSAISSSQSKIIDDAIAYATEQGIIVVVAAGNNNSDVANFCPGNVKSALTISAADAKGNITSFSNYGDLIDYASVGENGTSEAAAYMSSVIANIKSVHPAFNTEEIKEELDKFAINLGDSRLYGRGFVNYECSADADKTTKEDTTDVKLSECDWENMSDTEFHNLCVNATESELAVFIGNLSEDELKKVLAREELFMNPVEVFDAEIVTSEEIGLEEDAFENGDESDFDKVYSDTDKNQQAVDNNLVVYDHYYEYLLEFSQEMEVSEETTYKDGYFFVAFKKNFGSTAPEEKTVYKISFKNTAIPTGSGETRSTMTVTSSISEGKDYSSDYKLSFDGTQVYAVANLKGDGDWKGIFIKGATYHKILYAYASEKDTGTVADTRLSTYDSDEKKYTLYTKVGKNTDTDTISIQCNAYNCGWQTYGEKRYYGTLNITFKKYFEVLNIKYNNGTENKSVQHRSGYTTTLGTPSRDGYTFAGWKITHNHSNAEGSLNGTVYTHLSMGNDSDGNYVTSTAEAQWKKNYVQTVNHKSYNPSTGQYKTFNTTSTTVPEGDTFTPRYVGVPYGYHEHSIAGAYIVTSDTTTDAYYQPNSSTLQMDANGGTYSGGNPVTGVYSTSIAIAHPTREGYTFKGWTLNSGAAGSYSNNVYSFGATGNTLDTLTAQWERIVPKYRLDVNAVLDNTSLTSSANVGVFDITVNGQTFSNQTDYCNDIPEGSTYSITNIRGVNNSITPNARKHTGLSGTITANVSPVISFSTVPTMTHSFVENTVGSSGWFKEKATPVYTANAKSGIKSVTINGATTPYPGNTATANLTGDKITTEGTNSLTYYCNDVNGNKSITGTLTAKVDASKPTKVRGIKPDVKASNKKVTLTLKADDRYSGVCRFAVYKVKGLSIDDLEKVNVADKSTWEKHIYTNGSIDYKKLQLVGSEISITANTSASATKDITENGLYIVRAYDQVGYDATCLDDFSSYGKNPDEPQPGPIVVDEIDTHKPTTGKLFTGSDNAFKIPVPYYNIHNEHDWYGAESELKITAQDAHDSDKDIMSKGLKQLVINGKVYETPAKGGEEVEKKMYKYQTGLNTWKFYAEDNAGNVSDTDTFSAYIDDVKPVECTLSADATLIASPENGIPVTLSARDNESGLYQLNLMYTATTPDDFVIYDSYSCEGSLEQVTHEFFAKANGFYMLQAIDCVGNVYNDEDGITYIGGIDGTKPSVQISPDTTEWVNEATGVDLTATAKDEDSGVAEVVIKQKNAETEVYNVVDTATFEMLKDENTGKYLTHINGDFKAKATDGVGNFFEMPDKDALNVPNIDPVKPTIKIDSDLSLLGTSEGIPVTFYAQDSESGLGNIELQKLDANGNWKNTDASFATETYISGEEKEINKKGLERLIIKAENLAKKPLGMENTGYKGTVENIKGTTDMLKAVFTVKESGTYRVVVDDVVLNDNGSEAMTLTIDSSLPVIMVEGNPTEWTNQTATLKVSAKDDNGKIVAMTLDGASQKMSEKDGVFSFLFDAEQNATFTVTAADEAGNVATQIIDVTKIDKVAPSINASIGAFNKGTAQAQVNLTDDLSGINTAYFNNLSIDITDEKSTSYTHDITAGSDYEILLMDKAGNKTVKQISKESNFEYIKITTPPDKTEYTVGEDFDKTGMIVTAYYTDGTEKIVTDYKIENGDKLTTDITQIQVSYTEDNITSYDTTPVTVKDTTPVIDDDAEQVKEQKVLPKVTAPKTGDDTPIAILIATMIVSIILLAAVVYKIKKRQK